MELTSRKEGFISPKDYPRVQNPKSGIIVSANNLATSKNIKYGVSHAFQFQHRFLRIRQMLQEKIDRGEKLDVQDMMAIQQDTLDI
jgi:penicillin G amidase